MPVSIADPAIEQSTFEVEFTFIDEDGNAVAPDTMTWTLHDGDLKPVNDREAEVIVTPGQTEIILLQGDDLKLDGNDPITRYILLEGTYTSVTHGAGLPFRDQIAFGIEPLLKI